VECLSFMADSFTIKMTKGNEIGVCPGHSFAPGLLAFLLAAALAEYEIGAQYIIRSHRRVG